jgi:succinylglutamate desuccinylase
MSERENAILGVPDTASRVLGRIRGDRPGPTLFCVGGIHGNEPAGVAAARRVLEALSRMRSAVRGEFVAVRGNLRALEQRKRFVDRDLNRAWGPLQVERVLSAGDKPPGAAEDAEQRALLQVIDRVLGDARGESYFLDLHTSSAHGCPFVTVGDTLRNRDFAVRFPLPLILGLEEQVDGALLEHLNNRGLVTMGVEGGQHEAPESVDYLEAVLRLAIVAAGIVERGDVPQLDADRRLLSHAAAGAPRVIEVRYRRAVSPGDGFTMNPGFTNFQPVTEGAIIAHDESGAIAAPQGGLILLPLYQGQGDDGFFIAREVKPFWLKVSTLLRRMRIGDAVRFLPGVRPHSTTDSTWVVDTRVARLFPLEILHLLGFRKLRKDGPYLLVSRRRFDLNPPPRA